MQNHVLRALSSSDRAALLAGAEVVELEARQHIEKPNDKINGVYFIEEGIAAVIVLSGQDRIAAGLIGSEGATGIGVILGNTRSPHSTVMLTQGRASCVSAAHLTAVMDQRSELRRLLLRYCLAFYNQAAHTALSNASSTIEQRVARWVLMIDDRFAERGQLTHDVISFMLNTRRAGVTQAFTALKSQGLVEAKRGFITVLDRAKLEEFAGHFYGLPEKEFVRLIGTDWPPLEKASKMG
jgi:CRP-like cAMP-binding protein